jgi:hypothetical protein
MSSPTLLAGTRGELFGSEACMVSEINQNREPTLGDTEAVAGGRGTETEIAAGIPVCFGSHHKNEE